MNTTPAPADTRRALDQLTRKLNRLNDALNDDVTHERAGRLMDLIDLAHPSNELRPLDPWCGTVRVVLHAPIQVELIVGFTDNGWRLGKIYSGNVERNVRVGSALLGLLQDAASAAPTA